MRVTTRGQYGVRALFELAMRPDSEPVPLREIAQRQGLPENYLEQLMAPLRKAGIVRSVRGAHGGYLLAKDPDDISVGDILRVLEGPMTPVDCGAPGDSTDGYCADGESCVICDVWNQVRDAINQVIDGITLAELRDKEIARSAGGRHTYYI